MVVAEAGAGDEMSLSNMVLGFYEEAERERRPEGAVAGDGSDDGEGSSCGGAAESRAFWEEQHSQLHEALAKTSSAESRIQADTEEAVSQMRSATDGVCSCASGAAGGAGGCRSCALRFVTERLRGSRKNCPVN